MVKFESHSIVQFVLITTDFMHNLIAVRLFELFEIKLGPGIKLRK